jgi:hypothetical protein
MDAQEVDALIEAAGMLKAEGKRFRRAVKRLQKLQVRVCRGPHSVRSPWLPLFL